MEQDEIMQLLITTVTNVYEERLKGLELEVVSLKNSQGFLHKKIEKLEEEVKFLTSRP